MNPTDHLIINNPYKMPTHYLKYIRETRKFEKVEGRRPAGYVVASECSKSFDDPGIFIELPLVNNIREKVDKWRQNGYNGITGITKELLEYWKNKEREINFFFCQIEAIETIIWLTEAKESEKQGIEIIGDGSLFQRICSKMATGSGKTILMAMLIAWQVLNKVTYPKDTRFSKNVLVVSPGLTVKSRLQVLNPSNENNYYKQFDVIPYGMFDKLRQGNIKIINWHTLAWETEEKLKKKKSVDKRGVKSDEAYVREVLGEMANSKNIIVINDEAHHAWRLKPDEKGKYTKDLKEDLKEATIWISGLDRIHKTRNILKCFDFSATPFYQFGNKETEKVFEWIISDFSLNDAIESGLVKTPRVVIRDDGTLTSEMKSRFYHIYNDPEVKANLSRQAEPYETLPDLVTTAYYHLGLDWLATLKLWKETVKTPPVMITICNRTETSARIEFAFNRGKIRIEELTDPKKTLRIDSKVLQEAEQKEERTEILEQEDEKNLSKKEFAEFLREQVDTVGKIGCSGEQLQNIISVGMLSEGWDAKTVTHIMGLRAFSSQLLCEQVVGRGLRRTEYDVDENGLFKPEYVNIFGVPFTFLPYERGEDTPPPPPKPTTRIYADENKKEFEIIFPNVIRINHIYTPKISLDISKVEPLELIPEDTPFRTELAPIIEGKTDVTKLNIIDLTDEQVEESLKILRKQKLIFEISQEIYDQVQPTWTGNKHYLLIQLVKIVEEFIESDKLIIIHKIYQEELRKRLLILLNLNKIVQHLFSEIRFENTEKLIPIFDKEIPIKSTSKMTPWHTSKPSEITQHSHISHVVFDSTWEASEAFELDRNEDVCSWVKNDHIGFVIYYVYRGMIHKYYPDFLIKLKNEKMLVLEIKGQDTPKDKTKREFLKEWINAINSDKRAGKWCCDVSFSISDIKDIIKKHLQ